MTHAVVVTVDAEHRCSWATGHVVVVGDDGVSVGRGDDNDLVVRDDRVSRRDARFVVEGDALRVVHTGVSALRKNDGDVYAGEDVVDGDRFAFGGAVVSVVDADEVRAADCGNGWFIDARLRRPLSGPVFAPSPELRHGWLVRGPPDAPFARAFDLGAAAASSSSSAERPRWLPPLLERWRGDDGLDCLVFGVPDFVDAHQLVARAGRVDDDVAVRLALDLARALRHRFERQLDADGALLGVTFAGATVVVPRAPLSRGARADDATIRPVLRLLRRAAPLRHVDLQALQARAEAPGPGGSLGAVVELLQRAARDVGVAADRDLAVVVGGFFEAEQRRARQRDEQRALVDGVGR